MALTAASAPEGEVRLAATGPPPAHNESFADYYSAAENVVSDYMMWWPAGLGCIIALYYRSSTFYQI